MERLRFGILGAGRIAGGFAQGVGLSECCEVTAVGSRSLDKAQQFATEHGISGVYGSYEQLCNAPDVDAIYVATPNSIHKDNVLMAFAAAKHVLCEKPMATSAKDAELMFDEAKKRDLVLLEGFPFRFQPQTQEVLRRSRAGDFGTILSVDAHFTFQLNRPDDVRWDPALGGGSLWDVGVYPINLVRALLDSNPAGQISASVDLAESGVDQSAVASAEYPGGVQVTIACGFDKPLSRFATIRGTKATVMFSYANSMNGPEEATYRVRFGEGSPWEEHSTAWGNGFALEADGFAAVVAGEPNTGTTPEETIDNIATVEAMLDAAKGSQG